MTKQRHALEQRCRLRLGALLHHLDLSQVGTMPQFCQAVAAYRQRAIHLLPLALPAGLTGIWLAETDADTIVYPIDAASILINQAIAHELGHMLLDHKPHGHTLSASVLRLFSCLAPERVLQMLGHSLARSSYEDDEEYAAEYFATLLERMLALQAIDAATAPGAMNGANGLLEWANELRGES